MEEKKVRRTIHFNDIEKIERFKMLYSDLFQNLTVEVDWDNRSHSRSMMKGFEYEFVFHMSKDNFDMLKKKGVVKKIRQASYKDDYSMKNYKKDIWVLC